MMTINTDQVERLRRNLGDMQIRYAERNTLNGQAFETQKNARATVQRGMVNRNDWTRRSIRVETAQSLRDSAMTGSTERYMAHQEFGYVDSVHTSMATPAASGEAPRSRVRRRPVRRKNRMSAINLGARVTGMSRAQRNIVALKQAKEDGRKFVFLDRGRTKGIYRVMGTVRKPKSRMVQNLSRTVAITPRNPWLRPSSVTPERTRAIFFEQMRRQVRHLR
jgi:hypothetical protein